MDKDRKKYFIITSVELPRTLNKQLKEIAVQKDVSRNKLINMILSQYVAQSK